MQTHVPHTKQSDSLPIISLHVSSSPHFAGLSFNPHHLNTEEEERERRQEDLGLGRPQMPEPSHMGLDYSSLLRSVPRRASITSPLSQQASPSEDTYTPMEIIESTCDTAPPFPPPSSRSPLSHPSPAHFHLSRQSPSSNFEIANDATIQLTLMAESTPPCHSLNKTSPGPCPLQLASSSVLSLPSHSSALHNSISNSPPGPPPFSSIKNDRQQSSISYLPSNRDKDKSTSLPPSPLSPTGFSRGLALRNANSAGVGSELEIEQGAMRRLGEMRVYEHHHHHKQHQKQQHNPGSSSIFSPPTSDSGLAVGTFGVHGDQIQLALLSTGHASGSPVLPSPHSSPPSSFMTTATSTALLGPGSTITTGSGMSGPTLAPYWPMRINHFRHLQPASLNFSSHSYITPPTTHGGNVPSSIPPAVSSPSWKHVSVFQTLLLSSEVADAQKV